MGCFVQGEKSVWIFCPPRQISVGCFVHPGKVVWDLLFTTAKNGMEAFVHGIFCPAPYKNNLKGDKQTGRPFDHLRGTVKSSWTLSTALASFECLLILFYFQKGLVSLS